MTPEQKPPDRRYSVLVDWIIYSYDKCVELQGITGRPTEHLQGETESLRTLLHFIQGMEQTDLEGLREKFKKD